MSRGRSGLVHLDCHGGPPVAGGPRAPGAPAVGCYTRPHVHLAQASDGVARPGSLALASLDHFHVDRRLSASVRPAPPASADPPTGRLHPALPDPLTRFPAAGAASAPRGQERTE